MIVFYFGAIKIILLFFPCQRYCSLICIFREFLYSVLTQLCIPKWCFERGGHRANCQGQAINFVPASGLTSLTQGWSTFPGGWGGGQAAAANLCSTGWAPRNHTIHLLRRREFSCLISHDPVAEGRQVITNSRVVPQEQSQNPKSLACAGQSCHVQMWGLVQE